MNRLTDIARFSQLLAYIGFDSKNDIEEHFLFYQPLLITKTGEDIFNVVGTFFRENNTNRLFCQD